MKPSVVAVVISHDAPEFLTATLQAVKTQTHSVERILVIDTSTNDECQQVARDFGITEFHRLSSKYSLANSLAFATKQIQETN
jgi:glycosyltransferase involved in cell wall biosynthesis